MRTLVGILLLALVQLTAHSQVGLEGIIVEKFYVSDNADSLNADENGATYPLHVGSVTYRVYADLLPDYKVIQMFGSQTHPLTISTTTSFYNDPNYSFSTYNGLSVVNTRKYTQLIDSYLTIGGVAAGLLGVLKTEDTDGTIGNQHGVLANDDASAGSPINGTEGIDGLMPGTPILPNILGLTTELDVFDQTPGGTFTTSGGTVAALGGAAGVTASNHVLLGQFTTDGVFSFTLNLQLATPVEGESQIFVADAPGVNEFTDSTLTYTSPIEQPDFVLERGNGKDNTYFLYPNPCEEAFTIGNKNAVSGKTDYKILDSTGRIVANSSFTASASRISTSELISGVYTIVLENNGAVEVLKFIRQ
jgi:Secretion system C-terminal sorting domain